MQKIEQRRIKTPLGTLTLVASVQGMRAILFEGETSPDHPILLACEAELREYFAGNRRRFDVPLEAQGTEFQQKVWRSLLQIPFGSTWSYQEQARYLGMASAVRAVAAANGRNPLPILIPCHRVIAANGKLQGYSGGLEIKRQLLVGEGIKLDEIRQDSFL